MTKLYIAALTIQQKPTCILQMLTLTDILVELSLLPLCHQKDLQLEEKRMEHIVWKTDMMEKKMKEMSDQAGMMQKTYDKTEKAICELE